MQANYDDFPFERITTQELTQMMMDSFRIGDVAFAVACREELKLRPDIPAQTTTQTAIPTKHKET